MASELYVETLKGLTSGANANKVIIPSGQTLDASAGTVVPSAGQVVQQVVNRYRAGTYVGISTTSSSYVSSGVSVTMTPKYSDSIIEVSFTTGRLNANAAQGGRFKVFQDSVDTGVGFALFRAGTASSGSNQISAPVTYDFYVTGAGTSSTIFTIYFMSESSGNTFYLADADNVSLSVTEIKQ